MAEGSDQSASAPLIRESEDEISNHHRATRSQHDDDVTSPNAFIWALAMTAGISGLLFGYEYEDLPLI